MLLQIGGYSLEKVCKFVIIRLKKCDSFGFFAWKSV